MIVVHTRSLVSISPEKSVCSCKSLHVVERACIPTTSSPVIDIGVGMGLVCESSSFPPSHARSLAHALISAGPPTRLVWSGYCAALRRNWRS